MCIYTLYIKTHNKTGLKYLGFTKLNPFTYTGSGKYWSNHIRVHGNDVSTSILLQTQRKDDIKSIGLYYSKLWNIVESKEWANLKLEDGYGGAVPKELRADVSGNKNPRYDHKLYDFYNLESGEHIKSTRHDFCTSTNISKSAVGYLINGSSSEFKGWSMSPIRLLKQIYKFFNKESNITVCMTQRNFCDQYQLRYSIITEVINGYGRRKSYKGWSVIL
jgi:hypothetical protein